MKGRCGKRLPRRSPRQLLNPQLVFQKGDDDSDWKRV
jgi:hypothetical protein